MTRERAKELAPIIKAYGDGAEIEFLNSDNEWDSAGAMGCPFRDGTEYRIKPELKKRPMTRGEVIYRLTEPHCVIRFGKEEYFPVGIDLDQECVDNPVNLESLMEYLDGYTYAIIDKHGDPIDGWHKFEVEE
jgi:hypothetical protein